MNRLMDEFVRQMTRLGILLFTTLVALGPLYTVAGYSPVTNVISELAAQGTPGNYIMSAGFVVLGLSLVVDGLRPWRAVHLPFMAFGFFFGGAGLFGHRPIDPELPYTLWVDAVHSALATLAGIALTAGFVGQGFQPSLLRWRVTAFTLAALCVLLPLLMLSFPPYQGLIQRFMYLCVFFWLWEFYPTRARAYPSTRS